MGDASGCPSPAAFPDLGDPSDCHSGASAASDRRLDAASKRRLGDASGRRSDISSATSTARHLLPDVALAWAMPPGSTDGKRSWPSATMAASTGAGLRSAGTVVLDMCLGPLVVKKAIGMIAITLVLRNDVLGGGHAPTSLASFT
jgi:hypothetical protein